MSETRISWSANETESIEPFKTLSKGLELCAHFDFVLRSRSARPTRE